MLIFVGVVFILKFRMTMPLAAGSQANWPDAIQPNSLPSMKGWKYSWDKSGRLVGLKDNKRGTSNYRYDVRDQIERIKRITGLDKQTEEQFGYNSLMNLAFSKGEQHKYENGTIRTIGNSSYRYDLRGRLKEKRVVKNGFRPKTWHYLWDDFDRLIETRTPDGAVWQYSYDAFGRRIKKECTKAGEFTKQQATSFSHRSSWHNHLRLRHLRQADPPLDQAA
jgi:YD repeat-containing protein